MESKTAAVAPLFVLLAETTPISPSFVMLVKVTVAIALVAMIIDNMYLILLKLSARANLILMAK